MQFARGGSVSKAAAKLPSCTGEATCRKLPPSDCQPVVPSSKLGFCKRLGVSAAWRMPARDRMVIIRVVRITIREIFNLEDAFLEDAHILSARDN